MQANLGTLPLELKTQIRKDLFEVYMVDMGFELAVNQPLGIARMKYGIILFVNYGEGFTSNAERYISNLLHVDKTTRGIAIDLLVAESYEDGETEVDFSNVPTRPFADSDKYIQLEWKKVSLYIRDYRQGKIEQRRTPQFIERVSRVRARSRE